MPNDNGKESFKGEKEWDLRNKGLGGGIVTYVKGARIDDHRDALKDVREKLRQPSSSMSGSSSSGVGSGNKR
ncbi:hypothetical protein [Wolbachia endosymbiont (group A) of Paraperithous gnathaulax]|uniref:hypothetical protein n=1 Tax=Wolbachia endosymbiont (group A) of Paraperithous gnathaulax TaxID=3066212 RepID=UPI00333F65D1